MSWITDSANPFRDVLAEHARATAARKSTVRLTAELTADARANASADDFERAVLGLALLAAAEPQRLTMLLVSLAEGRHADVFRALVDYYTPERRDAHAVRLADRTGRWR